MGSTCMGAMHFNEWLKPLKDISHSAPKGCLFSADATIHKTGNRTCFMIDISQVTTPLFNSKFFYSSE